MQQDAFSAGVEPGGLLSHQQIKILVCYLLAGIDQPLSRKALLDVVVGQGMANYFELESVTDDLVQLGHVAETEQGLVITAVGRQTASTLEGMLPFTLRQRSVKTALQLLARARSEKQNRVTMEKLAHGVAVTCVIDDGEYPLLSLTLRVADDLQARILRERFLDDPQLLYQAVLTLMDERKEE